MAIYMGIFLSNYRKALKALLVTLFAVLVLYHILFVLAKEEKHPYEYGDSVWKCSDPNIELIYEGNEEKCVYYSPDGEVELYVEFDFGRGMRILKEEQSIWSEENVLLEGKCAFDYEFFIVRITKNELFDGDCDELIFERIK